MKQLFEEKAEWEVGQVKLFNLSILSSAQYEIQHIKKWESHLKKKKK